MSEKLDQQAREQQAFFNTVKEKVKNKSYWITLDKLNNLHNIEWKWVKAHSGDKYNDRADKLATSAI